MPAMHNCLQTGLQSLTCNSQIWPKSSYSHSGFSILQKFLTQYNFGNCLNIKNKNSQSHLILADTSTQFLPEIYGNEIKQKQITTTKFNDVALMFYKFIKIPDFV